MSVVARARVAADDVLAGLLANPKRLPCRLLYDEHGAQLFDQITQTEDYYPTRVELRLLDDCLPKIAAEVGVAARVIEPGSGAGIKTKRLLRALDQPASYIAIDVAREALDYSARVLRAEHPQLDVHTIVGDFTRSFALPAPRRLVGRTLVFFPGSTIGNFEPHDAVAFLGGLQRSAGANSRLVLGADGTRELAVVERAYNDLEGVTADFNKNVLAHLNRARNTNFDLDAFEHRAIWNERHSRIEMRLISTRDQQVDLDGTTIEIAVGEPIITEYSYKHSLPAMRALLRAAGWQVREVFTGKEQPMRLWLCEPCGV
ncbi:MAG TPA: L-histidine N(alpha)-methyltransferase [Kofleriaceae bacterium]